MKPFCLLLLGLVPPVPSRTSLRASSSLCRAGLCALPSPIAGALVGWVPCLLPLPHPTRPASGVEQRWGWVVGWVSGAQARWPFSIPWGEFEGPPFWMPISMSLLLSFGPFTVPPPGAQDPLVQVLTPAAAADGSLSLSIA